MVRLTLKSQQRSFSHTHRRSEVCWTDTCELADAACLWPVGAWVRRGSVCGVDEVDKGNVHRCTSLSTSSYSSCSSSWIKFPRYSSTAVTTDSYGGGVGQFVGVVKEFEVCVVVANCVGCDFFDVDVDFHLTAFRVVVVLVAGVQRWVGGYGVGSVVSLKGHLGQAHLV